VNVSWAPATTSAALAGLTLARTIGFIGLWISFCFAVLDLTVSRERALGPTASRPPCVIGNRQGTRFARVTPKTRRVGRT